MRVCLSLAPFPRAPKRALPRLATRLLLPDFPRTPRPRGRLGRVQGLPARLETAPHPTRPRRAASSLISVRSQRWCERSCAQQTTHTAHNASLPRTNHVCRPSNQRGAAAPSLPPRAHGTPANPLPIRLAAPVQGAKADGCVYRVVLLICGPAVSSDKNSSSTRAIFARSLLPFDHLVFSLHPPSLQTPAKCVRNSGFKSWFDVPEEFSILIGQRFLWNILLCILIRSEIGI